MAIFAIRSAKKNANEDSRSNPNNDPTKAVQQSSNTASRPTATIPSEMMQFDDDMAHFVSHLDADPLAESQLKMHLVEYNYPLDDRAVVREIPDDEDEYTYYLPSSDLLTL